MLSFLFFFFSFLSASFTYYLRWQLYELWNPGLKHERYALCYRASLFVLFTLKFSISFPCIYSITKAGLELVVFLAQLHK